MAEPTPPTAEELGPLLDMSGSAVLDEEPPDPYADENPAYIAAARTAVGSDAKANALKDAILECLREHVKHATSVSALPLASQSASALCSVCSARRYSAES